MKESKLVKFIKKNRKYFKASSSILEVLWQARGGGNFSKVLAGVSASGELLDVIFPDQDPWRALRSEGLVYYDSAVAQFIHKLLLQSETGEVLAMAASSAAIVWREDDEVKFGILTYSSGYVEFYIRPGSEDFLVRLIRDLAWGTSNELELSKSSNQHDRNSIALIPMQEVGPYVGAKGPEWYADRIKKYPPGPRTVLFRGPTGAGKGVLARRVSRLIKGTDSLVLKISAESLANCQQKEVIDLVTVLQPTVLLLDDLQLDQPSKTESFLALFESLRHPECLVIATMMVANKTKNLKMGSWHFPGMRPGRIDETFILELPNEEDRLQILSYYAARRGCIQFISDVELMKKLVEKTEGLSGAYLSAVIDRLATHGTEDWEKEVNQILYSAPALAEDDDDDDDNEEDEAKKDSSKKTTSEKDVPSAEYP